MGVILFIACGGGGSTSSHIDTVDLVSSQDRNISETPTIHSLKDIELYDVNLKQVNGSRSYDIEKFDGTTSSLTPYAFNFESKNFILRSQEEEIFVDGQRNSFSNINYGIDTSGRLTAMLNENNIYSLELISSDKVKKSTLEEYRSDISIDGTAYTIKINYLSNFYRVNKLLSTEVFDDINDFTAKYKSKVFIGDYFKGLVFGENNKLQELENGKYSDAGTYEVKVLDDINILMIYPDNSDYYYAENSCYILNFSRIWESTCYLKGSQKEKLYYDKKIYEDILLYLQKKFQTISFQI